MSVVLCSTTSSCALGSLQTRRVPGRYSNNTYRPGPPSLTLRGDPQNQTSNTEAFAEAILASSVWESHRPPKQPGATISSEVSNGLSSGGSNGLSSGGSNGLSSGASRLRLSLQRAIQRRLRQAAFFSETPALAIRGGLPRLPLCLPKQR
jgi:hypothetical protein